MQQIFHMRGENGKDYDVPENEMEEFKQYVPNAMRVNSHFGKNGKTYDVPENETEEFKQYVPDAQPMRRYSFSDGSTRDFTVPELAKFLRSDEYRKGERYAKDREADEKAMADWQRRRDAAQAAVPSELQPRGFGSALTRNMLSAEGIRETAEDSPSAWLYGFFNDVANSFVGGIGSGSSKITEATGHLIGNNAVGNALVEEGRAGQQAIRQALPTDMAPKTGNAVVDKVADVGRGVASVTGEFLPAAIPGIGQAYAASTLSAGAVNRMNQVYDAAKENGFSDAAASSLAFGAGAVDALQNILLMKGFKGIWNGAEKQAADAVKQSLVKKLTVDTLKTGATMGAGGMAQDVVDQNVGIDREGNVGAVLPYDIRRTAEVGIDQFLEGGAFHLVNTGVHAVKRRIIDVKWEDDARSDGAEAARRALDAPEGRALVMCNNPEAAKKILEARSQGKDVSRKMLEDLGIPVDVAPSKTDRNALADTMIGDYRAYKEWQRRLPDAEQSAALNTEIAGIGVEVEENGEMTETASLIRQGVLSKIKDAKELDDPKRRADLVYEAVKGLLGDNVGIEGQPLTPPEPPAETPKNAPESVPPPEEATTPPPPAEPPQPAEAPESATPEPKPETPSPVSPAEAGETPAEHSRRIIEEGRRNLAASPNAKTVKTGKKDATATIYTPTDGTGAFKVTRKTFTHGFRGPNRADNEAVSQHLGETLDGSLALPEHGTDGTRFRMSAVKIGGEDAHVLFTINKAGSVTDVDVLKGLNAKRNPEGTKLSTSETLAAGTFEVSEGSIADFDRVWQEQFKPGITEHDKRMGREVEYVRDEPPPAAEVPAKTENGGNKGDAAQQLSAPVLSGDEVRKTMPGYDPKDWRTHVDKTGYVAPRMEAEFQRLLKDRKGKGNGEVVFLAGGNGSGKSTVANAEGAEADFIIDSTLGNLEVARKQIDAVLSNGQKPRIAFVYRTPEQALEGVVERVENGGHAVSPLSFADSHTKGIKNLRLLADEYGDRISIQIFDNSEEGMSKITLEQLEAKGIPDHAELRARANEVLGKYGRGLDGSLGARSVDGSGAEVEGAQGGEGRETGGTGDVEPPAPPAPTVNKGKGKVPAKKPKPVKADPKKAAKAVEGFVATDPTRKTLMHVHHDHDGGVAVATDGRVLIATKHGYDKNAKDDPEAPYPNWRQVIPDYDGKTYRTFTEEYVEGKGKWREKAVDLPVHTLETDPAAVSAACKKAASLAKAVGHEGAVYASIELPDGGRIMMDPAYLRKVADAMGANGITEIRAVAPNRPILAKNADTTIVAMPLRGGTTDAPTGRVSGNPLVIDAMTGRILTAPERSDNTAMTSRKWADERRKDIERGKKEAMADARTKDLFKNIAGAWKRGETDAKAVFDGYSGDGAWEKLPQTERTRFEEWFALKDENALAEKVAEYVADQFPDLNRWRKDLPREVAKIEKRIAAEDEIDALMAGEPPPAPAPKPVNKGKGKVPKSVQAAKALGSPDAASPLRPAPKGVKLVQGEFDGMGGEEVRTDRQGNPIDADGRLIIEPVGKVSDVTDDDFAKPTRNVQLPKIPDNVDAAIGANGKPVVIKKNIFEKNAAHHPELDGETSRSILERSLYNPDLVGQSQPRTKPYYRVAIQTGDGNAVTILDVHETRDNVEVVGWRNIDEKGFERLKRQAAREGGQFLILHPSEEGQPGALSGRPSGSATVPVDKTSRSAEMIPRPGGEVKGGAEKTQKTLDGQTIDPTGEKTDKNPLGKALVPKDGSIEQEIDAEIAADEALAAKGGGKPQGVPPAPAPGSAGNPNLDPSYEPEAFGSGIEGNPIARQQVIDKFRELFGDKVAIRGKNTRTLGPTVAGHFEPDAHIIRSKDPISLRTIPHEIGHFIDALLRRRGLARPPAVRHDLIALGKLLYGNKQPNGGYESEGFAELLKYYMQGNDAGLRKDAPAAYDWFMNRFAPANPDTMARIDAMRDMIDRFQNQSAVQAVRGISAPDKTFGQKVVDRIADVANALKPSQENWIDKGAFITKAMKASGINRLYDWRDALKRGDVAEATRIIENHPVLKWKLYNGKAGMRAFVALKDGLTDLSGTRRYTYGDLGVATPGHAPDEPLPTFREIFGDFTKRELDDFKHEYAIARIAKELYLDRGLEFGLTAKEVEPVLRKYANNTKFREALDRYTHYKHGVLHLLVDAGAMSQQQFEAIVDANPIYAKIARRRESADFFRNAMLRRGGKAVNERKGGGQMIEDIFDAGLVDDERIFRAAFQADLFRSLVRAGELAEANNAAPGGALQGTFSVGANWIKEVPNAKEAVTFTPEKLRKQVVDALNAAGAEAPSNVAGQPPLRGDTLFDALFGTGDNLTIFKERPSDGKNGIVSIYGEDGKLRTFELPENNAEGWAKGLLDFTDGKNASILEKWAEISVAGVRSGATMLNPEFALRNLMRDTFHAATLNQHGTFIPVVGSIEGLYHDLMGTAPKQMFEAMGLEMGGMLGRSRLASARKSNQYLMSSNWFEAQMRKGLTKAVADLVGVTENATRIKQFKLAYENMLRQGVSDKAARMIAGCNALDTTIDFLRSGYTGQKINRIVPFFNAGVQGLDQFARALGMLEPKAWDVKDSRFYRLGRTLLQGLAFLTTAALFSELYNRSDPERKRKAEELPPHERWNYISFDDLRIPVPYEAGYLFASIPRAVAAAFIDGDEKAVSECLKMFSTTFPLQVDSLHGFMRNAAFVGPLADVAFNEDWKYKTIVQQHVKDGKESWEWYGPRTTGLSKDLGKALHKVIGDSYFSAPAYLDTIFDGYTGGMYSKLARLAYGEADFSFDTSRPSDWPVVGTFFRRPESSHIPNDFYDERAKLERKAGSGTATIAEYGRLSAMDSIAKDIRPYWDANRRLMADRDMPRKERLDRMDENTRKATDAIRAMSKDEGVMRSHGMKALAAKLANPSATGDSWERAAKMLKADGATLQETQSALRLYGRAHGWTRDTVNKRLRLLTARW